MKKLTAFFLVAFATVITSCGGDKKINATDVPPPVVASFNAKYPGIMEVEWKTETSEGRKIYEAEFKMNDKKVEAEFDETGAFVREED